MRSAQEGGGLGAVKWQGVAVPEADGNRVGRLGAHQPGDKQALLVLRPMVSCR